MQDSNIPKEYIKEKPIYPTEIIDLPTKGIPYSAESSLASGKIEIRYPTAKDEDILTSKNLIQKGTVIDSFIKSLIVDKSINMDDLTLGDKNAIIIASRILAYGKDYPVDITCPKCGEINSEVVDISQFEAKEVDVSQEGMFTVQLPASKKTLKIKLLTQRDEKMIDAELKGLKKYNKGKVEGELTTRIKYAIHSIDGNDDRKEISDYVMGEMLALDAKALRDAINQNTPDIEMKFNFTCESCNHEERMLMPLGIGFFWPSSQD